mmetsp:Transcript_51141/g.95823  ORF Transcript_51141/g.95823 Transcript_51141/m.95823 type:complete len:448 (-) Transcript_51141:55-1398(-)
MSFPLRAACLALVILPTVVSAETPAERGAANLKLIKEHFAHLDSDLVLLPWFQKYVADDAVFKYCPHEATLPGNKYPNCVFAKGKEEYLSYVKHNLYSKHVYFTNTIQTPPVFLVSEDGAQVSATFDVTGMLEGKDLPDWEMEVMVWKFNEAGQIKETDFFTDTLFWHEQALADAGATQLTAIDIANHGLYPPLGQHLTFGQYEVYYNSLSVGIFVFSAITLFMFSQLHAVGPSYKAAVAFAGLSPFISAIEFCMSLFSFTSAVGVKSHNGGFEVYLTGAPYLHDWLFADLTAMPITLVGMILVLKLGVGETLRMSISLSTATVGMLLFAFYGDTYTPSLMVGIALFIFIAYMLCIDLGDKSKGQPTEAQGALLFLRYLIVVSWACYPFIAVLPMAGFGGEFIWKVMQIGYAACDIAMKGLVPLFTWVVAVRKTEAETKNALLPPLV